MIFDSHAHYDDKQFDKDRKTLLNDLKKQGVGFVVNVGASLETTKKAIELADEFDFIYAAAGVHPNETQELEEDNFCWLKEQTNHKKVVAVGEIGLDYYWDEPARSVQKQWFERQLEMAREVKLPVIIHSRDAAKDTLDMMKSLHAEDIGGVVHCFSYGKETARDYLNMGYYLGIGGVVTFNNAKKLKEVVEYTPLENILLETDCPYLAPVPKRGKRNYSGNLRFVAEEIAKIKNVSYEEVVNITEDNTKKMYGIK